MNSVEGVSAVFGGTIPAAIWHDYMTVAMPGQPAERSRCRRTRATERPGDPRVRPADPTPTPSPTETPTSGRPSDRPHGPDRPTDPTGPSDPPARPRPAGRSTLAGSGQVASLTLSSARRRDVDRQRRDDRGALPGVECTTKVPLASSTRSRIDARPTRPIRRNSRRAGVEADAVVGDLDVQLELSASTCTDMCAACACLPAFDSASCTTR